MRVRRLKVEYKLVPQEKARENLDVLLGLFTVMYGTEAGVDLVLIQTFLLYYVNQVILMLTSIFQGQFSQQRKRGLYQKKVTVSLTFTRRRGCLVHD